MKQETNHSDTDKAIAAELRLRVCEERFQELEHEVNTLKALALSTFARSSAYTLLVFGTLAMVLMPAFVDGWEPLLEPREVLVLGAAFLLVAVLMMVNAIQLSRGLRTLSAQLKNRPRTGRS